MATETKPPHPCTGCRYFGAGPNDCRRFPAVLVRPEHLVEYETGGEWQPALFAFPDALGKCGEFRRRVARVRRDPNYRND